MLELMRSSSKKTVDLMHLKPEHQGKWVIMSKKNRKIYAYSADPSKAMRAAEEQGCSDPILHKVMPFDKAFIS
jgi:hypothetical protein